MERPWQVWDAAGPPESVIPLLAMVGTLGAVHEFCAHHSTIPLPSPPLPHHHVPFPSMTPPPTSPSRTAPDPTESSTRPSPVLSLPWASSINWILPSHLELISSGCLRMSLMETPKFDFQGLLSLPTRRSDNQGMTPCHPTGAALPGHLGCSEIPKGTLQALVIGAAALIRLLKPLGCATSQS